MKKSEKPENLIPESKMIDVLTELALLHAARNFNKQKLEDTGIDPEAYFYEKFDIDSIQLQRSSDWYSEQYTQYEGIYDSVRNRVQRIKNELDSLRKIEVKIEDSIRQVKRDSMGDLDSLDIEEMNKRKESFEVDSLKQQEFEEILREQKDTLIEPVSTNKN